MRIELFGLPGVGKTHILNALADRYPGLRRHYLRYGPSSWEEVGRDMPYFARHPRVLLSTFLEPDRAGLMLRLRRVARRKPYIEKHDNCILEDSGTIQPLVEAYIISSGLMLRADWEALFRDAVMGHHYFFIADSVENAVRREVSRRDRRFSFGEAELVAKYLRCKRLLERVRAHMTVREFIVSDYDNIGDMADEMHGAVSSILWNTP